MSFLVIETTAKNGQIEVSVVPSNWVQGNMCWWPDSRVSQHVKARTSPKTTWKTYMFKTLKDNLATFEKANEECQKFSEFTNTDSELEDKHRKAQQRANPTHQFIEKPANFNKMFENASQALEGSKLKKIKTPKTVKPTVSPTTSGKLVKGADMRSTSAKCTVKPGADLAATSDKCSSNSITEAALEEATTPFNAKSTGMADDASDSETFNSPSTKLSSSSRASTSPVRSLLDVSPFLEKRPKGVQELLTETLVEVRESRAEARQTSDELNARMDQLFVMCQSLAAAASKATTIALDPSVALLPLPIIDATKLFELESKLKDTIYSDQMVRLLVRFDKTGTLVARVKSIMEGLLAYDLTVQFSWSGKACIENEHRTKYAFCDLQEVQKLIHRTVLYRSIDPIEMGHVKKAIHDYLRRGNSRLKQQLKKNTQK